jgi:APA family basic amino acid/polyamine antiporter
MRLPSVPSFVTRTKSIDQLRAQAERSLLPRSLTVLDLTFFGIGAIIGAGIFSTIGTAAAGNEDDGRPGAGPALVISFLITAVACGFTAFCYAELASMIPIAGSAYTYAYATLGEVMAWIIGWDLVLEYAVSNVAVAISWGDYANALLGLAGAPVPPWLAMDPRSAMRLTPAGEELQLGRYALYAAAIDGSVNGSAVFPHWSVLESAPSVGGVPLTCNVLAASVTVVVTLLCYRGIRESAKANAVMVLIKLVILAIVVVVGAPKVDTANLAPFAPNGLAGVQAGAAIIFFAFIGFDAVSTTAQECRDPGRDLPRGIIGSLVVCTVVYVAVTVVVLGMVPYTQLAGLADPLSYVFQAHGLSGLAGLVAVGAVIATTASLLVYQLGQPRILMAMSHDGLLPAWFGKVHPRYGTPGNSTLLTGFMVALPAALMDISEVVELSNIGTLFAFAVVCIGVLVLRRKRPDAERTFRVPAVWAVAPAGVVSCMWLASGLPLLTWVRFLLWLAVGMVIYLGYGRTRSMLSPSSRHSVYMQNLDDVSDAFDDATHELDEAQPHAHRHDRSALTAASAPLEGQQPFARPLPACRDSSLGP